MSAEREGLQYDLNSCKVRYFTADEHSLPKTLYGIADWIAESKANVESISYINYKDDDDNWFSDFFVIYSGQVSRDYITAEKYSVKHFSTQELLGELCDRYTNAGL